MKNLIFFIVIVFSICSCKNVKKSNTIIVYKENYDSLHLKIIGAKIDGKKEGLWLDFNESGIITMEQVYVNDSINGIIKLYFDNGKIMAEGNVKNDKRNGLWIDYFCNGKIRMKGDFIEDKRNGIWEIYTENGYLAKKLLYKDDKDSVILDNKLLPEVPMEVPK